MCGHAKRNTLSVRRKFLDEGVLVQSQCNVHQSQHTSVQYSANPCSTLPIGNKVRFLHGDLKIAKKNCWGSGRGARLRRKSLGFRNVPQPRLTLVFQNPWHAGTMKQASDGSRG